MVFKNDDHNYEYTSCHLCGSTDVVVLHRVPDLLLQRDNIQATFVKCIHCGLIYQNPRPSINHLSNLYPSTYPPFDPQQRSLGWISKKLVKYGLEKRCNIVTRYKKRGRLLDLGCATGDFLHAMSSNPAWELFGVDTSRHAAEIARTKYHINVFVGSLEEALFPLEYFDVITIWEVLEHIYAPISTLEEINKILKPDGILVIRVPNFHSFDAKLFGKYWAGYDAPRHLYVFSPSTIERILNKAGFNIIETNTRYGNFTSFGISVDFWMRGKMVNSFLSNLVQIIIRNPIIRGILSPIFFLSGLTSHGSTLTIIAQKIVK